MAPFTMDLGGTRLAIRSAAEYYNQSIANTSVSCNQLLPALQDISKSDRKSPSAANPVTDGTARRADFVKRVDDIIRSNDQQHFQSVSPPQGVEEGSTKMANAGLSHEDPSLTRSHPNMGQKRRIAWAARSVIDLKDVQDDELLEILLKNETVATRFQRECHSRLEQHQQSLERAYKQRLDELERYTRQWRDNTEELWLAVKAGRFPATTQQQQEHLVWPGPQQMAHGLGLVSVLSALSSGSTDRHARTEMREPKDHSPKSPHTGARHYDPAPNHMVDPHAKTPVPDLLPHETSQLSEAARPTSADVSLGPFLPTLPAVQAKKPQTLGAKWVDDVEGYKVDETKGRLTKGSLHFIDVVSFREIGPAFQSCLKIPKDRRMVVKYVDQKGQLTYRDINAIHSVLGGLLNTDVIVDLTYENVALFGRALCYLKDRRDRLWSLAKLPGAPSVDDESQELCAFFSSQSTARTLRIKRFRPNEARLSDIFSAEGRSQPAAWKLLIVRPRHQEGRISGADFFDVGIERHVARLKNEMDIILPEDACTYNRIAAFLKFCTKYVADVRSMMGPMGSMRQTLNVPEVEDITNQEVNEQAGDVLNQMTNTIFMKPATLFERSIQLSSEFGKLTARTRYENPQYQTEQRWLQLGAETGSASRSISHCGPGQMQSLCGDVGPGGAAYFTDDAFDGFCRSLMCTELDGDDSSEIIALARPPPDVSFDYAVADSDNESDDMIILDGPPADMTISSVVESEEGSDDLIMLEGPPPDVRFGHRMGMPQNEEQVLSHSASSPAKRMKPTVAREYSIPEGQDSTGVSPVAEKSVGATDATAIATDESAGNRLILPPYEDHVVSVGSQEPQARLEAVSQPGALPQPGVATTTPSNLANVP